MPAVSADRPTVHSGRLRRVWAHIRAAFARRGVANGEPSTATANPSTNSTTTSDGPGAQGDVETRAAAEAHARQLLAPLLAAGTATPEDVDDDGRIAAAFSTLRAAIPSSTRAFRDIVAAELLRALDRPEGFPQAHAPWLTVAPLVADELVDGCTWESAWRLLQRSDAGAAVAAVVLARLPAPLGMLGGGRLSELVSSSSAVHRAAAIAAIGADPRAVVAHLVTTAALAETDHHDVRAALVDTLERADTRALGALQLALLLDATHDDVRACALRLLHRGLALQPAGIDVVELLARAASDAYADVRRALLPLARAGGDVRALCAIARAAAFDADATTDEHQATIAALSDACHAGQDAGIGAREVAEVLAEIAWRQPGTARDDARRLAANLRRRFDDLVLDPVLDTPSGSAG